MHIKLCSLEVDINPEVVVKQLTEHKLLFVFSPSTSFFIQNLFNLKGSHKYYLLKGESQLHWSPSSYPLVYTKGQSCIMLTQVSQKQVNILRVFKQLRLTVLIFNLVLIWNASITS